MITNDELLFTIHQFVIAILCLFFFYYGWKDFAEGRFSSFKKVSPSLIAPILIGLGVGLFIGFLNEWGSHAIVLSLAFSILIIFSIFDSKYAVAFFTFLLISRPWEFITNDLMSSMPRDISILCFLSLFAHKILRKEYYFKWNLAHAAVLLYSIWTFLTIIPSDQSNSAMIIFGEVFIKLILVYFLIVNVIKDKEQILPIQAAFIMALMEKSIMCFNNTSFIEKMAPEERLTTVGIIGNSNDLAAIMILAIPFSLSLFSSLKTKTLKYLFSFIVLFFHVLLIWKTKSRGAILGLGALFVTWYWIKAQNKKFASIVVIIGLIGSIMAMSLISRNSDDTQGSTQNRITFWKAGINMAIRNPLLGVGYEGFNSHLYTYAQGNIGSEGKDRTVHSNWILVLSETGFVGFFFYIIIWIYAFISAFKMADIHPEYLLGLISYGTAITFLSHSYMLYPYILLALTISMGQFYKNKRFI